MFDFLIILLFLGILPQSIADDQRSAVVSKSAPNATTNAFSDLPQKTQNWTRYLSVSTDDSSVFKQVDSVADDASSSWVLIDGYEVRPLPYFFPPENRSGYIHYRGTNNPDVECKRYQPHFSGIAGFIGGNGTQNNDYAWNVTTDDFHLIYNASITASANGNLPAPNALGEIAISLLGGAPDYGHANWKVNFIPGNAIIGNQQLFVNKIWGLVPVPGGLPAEEITGRGFTDYNITSIGSVFNYNAFFYAYGTIMPPEAALKPNQHTWTIDRTKTITVLNTIENLHNDLTNKERIYTLSDFNCTDACIEILNTSGINVNRNRFRKTVKGQIPFGITFAIEMTIPQLLGDWLATQP
jgi:hypothetical protein